MTDWLCQVVHDFHGDESAGQQLGRPRRSRHAIVDHKLTIFATINFRRRHSVDGCAEPGHLSMQFVEVSPGETCGRQVQISRIDIDEQPWVHARRVPVSASLATPMARGANSRATAGEPLRRPDGAAELPLAVPEARFGIPSKEGTVKAETPERRERPLARRPFRTAALACGAKSPDRA